MGVYAYLSVLWGSMGVHGGLWISGCLGVYRVLGVYGCICYECLWVLYVNIKNIAFS